MATEPLTAEQAGGRAWIAPAIALAVLFSLLAAVLAVARLTRDEALPAQPGAWVLPEPPIPTTAYAVQRATAGRLVLARGQDASAGAVELTVPSEATVDFLEPAEPADVEPGDWITVIGVRNEVRNFAIRLVVVTKDGGTPGADGWLRTPAGFVGHEAARDSREVPILAGLVTEVGDGDVLLDAGEGIRLTLHSGAPLRVLRTGTAAEIGDGDRVAFHQGADGRDDPAAGVLVLVGGAR